MAQLAGIGEVAIVRDREPAAGKVCENRLHVPQHGAALRRVPIVTDGGVAGEARPEVTPEMLTYHAQMTFRGESLAVKGNHPAGFLPAMLEGMQTERCQQAGFMISKDTEDAAFLAGLVVIMIEKDHLRRIS
jgi:hypothetical protein